jgi:hypothetical protein
MRRYQRIAITALAGASLLGLACKEEPVPGRVAIGGDSLTFQSAFYGGGFPAAWDTDQKVGLGWQAEHIQPRLTQDVENPAASPEVLVIALGHNDAASSSGRDGFTLEDQQQLAALAQTPHESACVAWVLPWYQPPVGAAVNAAHVAGINAYRTWVTAFAATDTARYRVVDWASVAMAHPEYIDPDGIHLNTSSGGPAAYQAKLAEAVASCGS